MTDFKDLRIRELELELADVKNDMTGEQPYLRLLSKCLKEGSVRKDRTGTGTISIFGEQIQFDLRKGFPLLTTKKINLDKVLGEYLAFIAGETDANVISEKYGFDIWTKWAKPGGDLGPIYGKQWREWETTDDYSGHVYTIDQLGQVINDINNNPQSRRLLVSAWNVGELHKMQLPPCHMLFQLYVDGDFLDLKFYQRSCDLFLGGPFNIAGYAILLKLIAQLTGKTARILTQSLGDAHIYLNHVDQVKLQLARIPRELPQLVIEPQETIDDYDFKHFHLLGYDPHPAIKGDVSV